MPEQGFEQALLERAAASMHWPETPALGPRVLRRLAAEPVQASRKRPTMPARTVLIAAAAMGALIVLAAALAAPGSRDAIADFFGVEGSKIVQPPTPAPGTTATPLPTPSGIVVGTTPVSIGEAQRALGFRPAVVAGREPSDVLLLRYGEQPVVIVRYAEYDIWETGLREGFNFGKEPAPGVRKEDLTISGVPAYWISGGPHFVYYEAPDGTRYETSERFVEQNTLVWSKDGVVYRIETDLARDDAVAVAESLEPAD